MLVFFCGESNVEEGDYAPPPSIPPVAYVLMDGLFLNQKTTKKI